MEFSPDFNDFRTGTHPYTELVPPAIQLQRLYFEVHTDGRRRFLLLIRQS